MNIQPLFSGIYIDTTTQLDNEVENPSLSLVVTGEDKTVANQMLDLQSGSGYDQVAFTTSGLSVTAQAKNKLRAETYEFVGRPIVLTEQENGPARELAKQLLDGALSVIDNSSKVLNVEATNEYRSNSNHMYDRFNL